MITLTSPPYIGAAGGWLTATLFLERWYLLAESERGYKPLFSLTGRDGYINARTTFIELQDPTGYKWSQKYLGSWEHMERLLKAPWFVKEFEEWVVELEMKLKSEAIQKVIEIASQPGPQAYLAAKYIAAHDWKNRAHGRGRPSKEELSGELKRAAGILSREQEDAARMGLQVPQEKTN